MDTKSDVNPAQNNSDRAELSVESETVTFHREPPPPYQLHETPVTNQPIAQTIVVLPTLKIAPCQYNCHNCGERILTKVTYTNTRKTHMLAGFICGFTFWFSLCGLAVIPYLSKSCKRAEHYCPNCNTFLGSYSKM